MKKNSFPVHHTSKYYREFKKIARKDKRLAKKILLISDLIGLDPFSGKLRTHAVNTLYGAGTYSSRVSRDIRILWRFEDGDIILLLTIGGHFGSSKVYK